LKLPREQTTCRRNAAIQSPANDPNQDEFNADGTNPEQIE